MKPKSIIVGGIKFKVFWNKDMREKGLCKYYQQEIWIRYDLNEETKKHVFFHEFLHAVWYGFGMNPRLSRKHHEEDVVNQFTPALLTAYRDNPNVVEYLFGDIL
jgi:hypothetical protein